MLFSITNLMGALTGVAVENSPYRTSIMNFEVSASASGSVLPRTLPCRIPLLSIVFLNAVITGSGCSPPTDWTVALPAQHEAKGEQNYYANAHPYLDESLEQLIKRMPELKTIQPVPDQQALPTILEKTGEQVDDFFRKVVDLAALEEITKEKWGGQGQVTERLQMEDSYLILRSGAEMFGTVNEYRMDSKGNRLEEAGLNNGYFVTSNFALSHVYFSTAVQSESRFRYLGEEKVGPRDTYVVAFAQTPGEATVAVGLGVDEGRGVHASVRRSLRSHADLAAILRGQRLPIALRGRSSRCGAFRDVTKYGRRSPSVYHPPGKTGDRGRGYLRLF